MAGSRTSSSLDPIISAARDGHLSAAQIRRLREIIAVLDGLDPDSLPSDNKALERSIYNAKVFDTQLRLILERLDERSFTPEEFSRLPPYLQARLKTRFRNIAQRFEATLKSMESAGQQTAMPMFRCKDELDACLQRSPRGMGRLWCQIAMATCLAATAYRMATGS